jgi:hypothetical protein
MDAVIAEVYIIAVLHMLFCLFQLTSFADAML